MSLYTQDFETGTNGSAFTWDTLANGAGAVCANDQTAHGTLSIKCNDDNSYQYVQKNLPSAVSSVAIRYYIRFSASNTTAEADDLKTYPDTTSFASQGPKIYRVSNGKMRLVDSTGATVWTSAVAPSVNTWYRVELLMISTGTGTAQFRIAYYLLDSTSAIEDVTSAATFTSPTIQSAHFGKVVTSAFTPSGSSTWFDDLAVQDAPSGQLIGPVPLPIVAGWLIGGIAW